MIHSSNSFTFIVTRTASRYRNILAQELASHGHGNITSDYRIVLEALWHEDNISIGQLAARVCKDNASLTRIIDGMERVDLVQRIRSNSDRRSSLIVLTQHSKSIRESVEVVEREVFRMATKNFSPIEAKEMERMLDAVFMNLNSK